MLGAVRKGALKGPISEGTARAEGVPFPPLLLLRSHPCRQVSGGLAGPGGGRSSPSDEESGLLVCWPSSPLTLRRGEWAASLLVSVNMA